eukprot:Clim_evm28s47 gene=Clim_evmTU28s47
MTEVDTSSWVCIYPAYFDRTKSRAEGRKLKKTECVVEPEIQKAFEYLKEAGVTHMKGEAKTYPRDILTQGRIKFKMQFDDGTQVNANYKNRYELLKFVAKVYREKEPQPQLVREKKTKKGKKANPGSSKQQEQEQPQQQQQQQQNQPSQKKRKGKKRRN